MLVSVLIPCHNAERWIQACIESALTQTCGPIEVIVADDGSTDSSAAIIQSFGGRIRCLTGPGRGGNAARNALLNEAAGTWVQFLDADDYLRPNKIAGQLESLSRSGVSADVIYSPVCEEVWCGQEIARQSVHTVNDTASLIEQWVRWQVAQTGTVLWKRTALTSMGGWNEEYPCCQDNEVTLRAILAGLRFHYCSQADAVYRVWTENTVSRKDPFRLVRYKTILIEQMLTWLKDRGELTGDIEAAAGQSFFEMSRTLAAHDLDRAVTYYHDRLRAGYYLPIGPAAPAGFRLIYRLAGFRNAERFARLRRRRS